MVELVYKDELYHYGVKGMKWGHRRAQIKTARQNYRQARKDVHNAYVNERLASSTAYGIKGLEKYGKATRKTDTAQMKALEAKVALKRAKARNKKAADRAEFRTYANAMGGLRGSAYDASNRNISTRVYSNVKAKKGKAYADRVEKRVRNQAVGTLVGGTAVLLGSAAVQGYLATKY